MKTAFLAISFLYSSCATSNAPSRLPEKRIKIIVLDTGVDMKIIDKQYLCKDGHKSVIKDTKWYQDEDGHGTNIYGLVTKNLNSKKYCVSIIKWYTKSGDFNDAQEYEHEVLGAEYAATLKGKYMNVSLNGYGIMDREFLAYKKLTEELGTIVFVAAGNKSDNLDLKPSYPASLQLYKNFYVVGNKGVSSSNYGRRVNIWEDGYKKGIPVMTGTSQATAIALNKYIRGVL